MQPMNWQWQRYRKILRIHVFSNRLSVNRHRRSYCPIRLLPCCMKAIVQALAGYYNDAFEKVAATSPFNEVVMLLAMKKNQEAWDKISTMDVETAREYYIKAIAANRLEKIGDAIMSIEKALELDPSLLEVAKVDGDIIDLLPEEQKIK